VHLPDLRRLRPKSTDDALMVWTFVAAILLGLLVVLIVGHPLDVMP
jgi:hypothetical protein